MSAPTLPTPVSRTVENTMIRAPRRFAVTRVLELPGHAAGSQERAA